MGVEHEYDVEKKLKLEREKFDEGYNVGFQRGYEKGYADGGKDERVKLKNMISTLRTVNYETVEVRDKWNNEICTCPTNSVGWKPYQDRKVVEWFPHGAPKKDATFTVFIE